MADQLPDGVRAQHGVGVGETDDFRIQQGDDLVESPGLAHPPGPPQLHALPAYSATMSWVLSVEPSETTRILSLSRG